MKLLFTFLLYLLVFSNVALASSFSADAIQIRDGQFNHSRMYWSDGDLRFEYLEDGVPMVQIIDNHRSEVIWLDTENKLFIKRDKEEKSTRMSESPATIKLDAENPCSHFPGAECTRLKDAVINERDTVKWLITLDVQGQDQHIFQWLDKKFNIPVRQQNPDGSMMDVVIQENLEMNNRKVRKQEIYAVGPDGSQNHSIQWFDSELEIVIRQQNDDGSSDELRNIKIENISKDMFSIPEDYKQFDSSLMASQPEKSGLAKPLTN